jgi:hypothetical protein
MEFEWNSLTFGKNQVSGYGFWTKFFMVFSYTVFLNNMFLRYMGVSRISGWSKKKKIIIGGLSEAKKKFWYQDFMQKSECWALCI